MTAKEYGARFNVLSAPARRVTEAYERAARHFDEMKEIVKVDFGLNNTSEFIHRTAHWFPGQFDVVGDILHQRNIRQEYGATEAFDRRVADMDEVYTHCVELLDEIERALLEFIRVCDASGCEAQGRQLENLQMAVSAEREKYISAWSMYDEANSPTSYDSWMLHLLNGEDGPAWAQAEEDDD